MATAKIEERIGALEREVQLLKLVIGKIGENQAPWWERLAGAFKDDPLFDEIIDAGRKYRRSAARRSR